MQLKRLGSSCLAAGAYDASTGELTLEHTDGAAYVYYDVPEELWRGLLAAESKGRYFAAQIRNAGFAFQRIG